jgi:hypothetical protein
MRFLVKGYEGATRHVFKGEVDSFNCMLLNDDGSLLNVTGHTVTLPVYDTLDRRNAPIFTATLTLTTPTAGFMTAPLSAVNTANLIPGATYYAFCNDTDGSGNLTIADKPLVIVAG